MATSDPWRGLRKNRLLASLGARDAMLLRGRLTRTHWNAGDTIAFPDTRLAVAYFPETLVACLGVTQAGSEGTLLGIIGNEGMFGWACLLYESRDAAQPVSIVTPGSALAISGRDLQALCRASPTLMRALFCYVDSFAGQLQRAMLSQFRDSLSARLARWLLLLHDRIEGDEIWMTHDQLAAVLHVRRATVTDCLHIIEGESALHCTRGCIRVRNRALLERHASISYGDAERSERTPRTMTAEP